MVEVKWTEKDSESYAIRFVNSLIHSTLKLETFPLCGRVVPELEMTKIREVIYQNYRIVYRVLDEVSEVHILSVVHSARDFQKTFREEWEL